MNLLILFGVLVFAFGLTAIIMSIHSIRQAKRQPEPHACPGPMWLGEEWPAQ